MGKFYPQITNEVNSFIQLIKDGLGSAYDVFNEFSDRQFADRLSKPTATVGIKHLESEDKWFQDYAGIYQSSELYGKLVRVTYEVTIHSPVLMGGGLCRTFLCKLRDVLYDNKDLVVSQITSGEIKYDRSRRCLYMPVNFVVKYIV